MTLAQQPPLHVYLPQQPVALSCRLLTPRRTLEALRTVIEVRIEHIRDVQHFSAQESCDVPRARFAPARCQAGSCKLDDDVVFATALAGLTADEQLRRLSGGAYGV